MNMQRRNALQSIALGLGGAFILPNWAQAWTPASIGFDSAYSNAEAETIAALVDTIIPKTDTPGAKELGVHDFLMRMMQDCTKKADQEAFAEGISSLEGFTVAKYGAVFSKTNAENRLAAINEIAAGTDTKLKTTLNTAKRYTIQGYTNSEYFLTNVAKFEFAPARFNGCVDLKS
jgi:hypothetical protein